MRKLPIRKKCFVCRGEDISIKPGAINWLCKRHADEFLITQEKAPEMTDKIMTENPRKNYPLYSGVIAYFPDALMAVAEVSRIGNEQHNPGQPLHWDRSKSGDELDALCRHLKDAGHLDTDGVRHSAKVAWRALANLQKELERARTDS